MCHCESPPSDSSVMSASAAGSGWPLSGSPTCALSRLLVRLLTSLIADARVDHGVEHVGNQVAEHDHNSEQETGRHDDRIVALQNCIDDHSPHAWPGKDDFHENRATEQERQV